MRFRLDIAIDDEEYIDFNKFNLQRSPYGNSYIRKKTIILSVGLGFIALCTLLASIILSKFLLYVLTLGIVTFILAYPIILRKLMLIRMEKDLRLRLANGEQICTKTQILEFYDDMLITDDGTKKSDIKYSDIEQICVVNRYVYAYSKQKVAYIIKATDFDSREEYARFLDFIESVFDKVAFYAPNKSKAYYHPYKLRVIPADHNSFNADEPRVDADDTEALPSRDPEPPLMDRVEK